MGRLARPVGRKETAGCRAGQGQSSSSGFLPSRKCLEILKSGTDCTCPGAGVSTLHQGVLGGLSICSTREGAGKAVQLRPPLSPGIPGLLQAPDF